MPPNESGKEPQEGNKKTMSHLIINDQIKKEITEKQLNQEKTIQQLLELCESLPSEKNINMIELSINDAGSVLYVWLISHDESTNNYYYFCDDYNDHKAWKLTPHKETNIKKVLNNLIDLSIKQHKKSFLKNSQPLAGYYLKELENNKPNTLLKAKNNNFVAFVVVCCFDNWTRFNEININENKKEYDTNFLYFSNNCWSANETRKAANKVFAIYNKDWQKSREQHNANILKHQERAKNPQNPLYKKYYYNDASFLNGLLNEYNLHIYYGFSHNSLMRHEFDTVAAGSYISFNGKDYPKTTEEMTRQDIFKMLVDKSGYFVFNYRYLLSKRAETLKRQREQERREKAQAEWIKSDHTEQANEIKRYMSALKVNYILPLLDFSKIMEQYAIKSLKILKSIYQDLESLLNFNEYTAERWQERKNNILNDWDFNKKIIGKKLFDVVACRHMYIKAANGQYIMVDKYKNDPYWGKYAQAF